MEEKELLFIESANRLSIDYLTKDEIIQIWDIFRNINNKNNIQYIPDNICYCFTDYALNILSKTFDEHIIKTLQKTAQELTLADVIYSLCIDGVTKDIANILANVWIKRCHKIYINIDKELKTIPRHLWNWIFDDREELYKKLLSFKICFIGKGEDLFSRVNIKNKATVL